MSEPKIEPTVADIQLATSILERLGFSVAIPHEYRVGWVAEEIRKALDNRPAAYLPLRDTQADYGLPLTAWGTTSLGDLIALLKRMPPEADMQFDFCHLRPTKWLNSYRGHYDHLALNWSKDSESQQQHWPKVSQLITWLEAADGKTYEGYKGGNYRMSRETPLWVDNNGDYSSTAIVGLNLTGGHTVIIVTAKVLHG